MKKRILPVILSLVCMLTCALGLVACKNGEDAVAVAEISLDITQITLTEGDEITLAASVAPLNATNQTLSWSSSDKSVAMVEDGCVFARSEGVAVIAVSSDNGKTAECAVTVEAKQEEQIPATLYTVTFYANGGKLSGDATMFSLQVKEDGKLPNVPVTRGEKYTFTGWYKDEARTQPWDFENDTVNDDTDIFAGWKYENDYQPVIDALANRIKTERQDSGSEVEILSVFKNGGGYLCFVERDDSGVFSYSTAINGFDDILENDGLISEISTTALTEIKNYNAAYTSVNNPYIADVMAFKYTDAANDGAAIIFSCVSEWEDDAGHINNGGKYYSCTVKAIVADKYGKIYDCSVTVVAAVKDFSSVIGGSAMSQEFDKTVTELDELAEDFYSEYIKTKTA